MKYRIFAFLVLSILVLNLGGSTFADSKTVKAQTNQLVSLLPASDGVATFNVKRFFSEALPKLLSSNQPLLAKVTGEIDRFKESTGIDVRQFDYIAAGATAKNIGEKKYDLDPVVIARGQISSASLIGAAKLASNGKYTEERIGDRTIYVFEGKRLVSSVPSKPGEPASEVVTRISGTVAVTAIDSTTIAFGTLDRVRQTVESRTKVGHDITSLLDRNQAAIVNFAAKMPAGMKSFIPLDNDELGKSIDSIQYVYGTGDMVGDMASVHMVARTLQNSHATSLFETLEGLQMLGKAFLGGAKGSDKQVFRRLIENVKFTVKANEVTFDLQVLQSDIDILVGSMKVGS